MSDTLAPAAPAPGYHTPEAILREEFDNRVRSLVESGNKNLIEEVRALKASLKAAEDEIAAARQRNQAKNAPDKEECQKFSFVRAMLANYKGVPVDRWKDYKFEDGSTAGFEGEMVRWGMENDPSVKDQMTRTQNVSTDTSGGFIAPPQIGNDLIERLRPDSTVLASGARQPTAIGIPWTLPKLTGGVSVTWVGESGTPTKSTATFGQVAWRPHRMVAHTKVTRRALRVTNPGIEQILRDDMAREMALGLDIAALQGTGIGGMPLGLLSTISNEAATEVITGLLSSSQRLASATNGDALTWVILQNLIEKVRVANALRGNGTFGFITHPLALAALRTQTVEQYSTQTNGKGTPIFGTVVSDEALAARIGYPIRYNSDIKASGTKGSGTALTRIFFGNWPELIMPVWGGLEFRASDVTGDSSGSALLNDELWIVCGMETDVNIRHPESFSFNHGITTT